MKIAELLLLKVFPLTLTLLHSERPKLSTILAFLGVIGLKSKNTLALTRPPMFARSDLTCLKFSHGVA